MVTLIIPAARDGLASHGGRPVWLQRLPTGRMALEELVSQLGMRNVQHIVFVTLTSHVEKYCNNDASLIESVIRRAIREPRRPGNEDSDDRLADAMKISVITLIPGSTSSAPETVCQGIQRANVEGAIFIKDSDGCFNHDISLEGNYVCGLTLSKSHFFSQSCGATDLLSRSFIERNGLMLTNLVEKQLISDTIAVGGYGFASAETFVKVVSETEAIRQRMIASLSRDDGATPPGIINSRLFVSHVVQRMLFANEMFTVALTEDLDDWKSDESFSKYKQTFKSIFVGLETQLFAARSQDGLNHIAEQRLRALPADASKITFYDNCVPNDAAIDRLVALKLRYRDRAHITVLSAAPPDRQADIKVLLERHAIPFDSILFTDWCDTIPETI